MAMRRKVIAGAAAALAVGGAGAGVAATKLANQSPAAESKVIVDAAAENLGVEPQKLSAAIKKALQDRVDAAVAAGRLTKAQGEELKQRIASDEFPLFGPPALGSGFAPPHPFFHGLDAAATYLGLTEAELRARVNRGNTLAEIAKAEGKSTEGLKAALRQEERAKLDAAVSAGRLSKAEEQRVLSDLERRIDELVDAQLRERFREHHGHFGFRGFDRRTPPRAVPGAAA